MSRSLGPDEHHQLRSLLRQDLRAEGGVLTLDQIVRRGFGQVTDGLPRKTLELRPLVTTKTARLITFVAAEQAFLAVPPRVLLHAVVLAEGRQLLQIPPEQLRLMPPRSDLRSPDAVWERGGPGADLDVAVECDAGYAPKVVAAKLNAFGPPPPHHLGGGYAGYASSIWITTSAVRARHLRDRFAGKLRHPCTFVSVEV